MDQHQLDHSDSEMDLADTSHSTGIGADDFSFQEQSTQKTELVSNILRWLESDSGWQSDGRRRGADCAERRLL